MSIKSKPQTARLETQRPKVFISYSWSSLAHQDQIRGYADNLINDGVEVIIDQYDLLEGQDKFHFMEQLISDPSVTHVLAFLDRQYAEKADSRKAGVGTESQIMSKDIYEKVGQTRFIPIFCELDENGDYYVPQFFKTRIGFDFTSPEKVAESWEKLIRVLFGKPAHVKPALGKPPIYLDAEAPPLSPSIGKLAIFKSAALAGKPGLALHRQEFLNAAIDYAKSLRKPLEQDEDILTLLHSLLPLRDQFVDWITLETSLNSDDSSLSDLLIDFLERLLPLRFQPADSQSWTDWWCDAHKILIYEVFLYLVSVLINAGRYQVVYRVLQADFLLPDEAIRNNPLVSFGIFEVHSGALGTRNNRLGLRRLSPVADVIKDRASRSDITFKNIMQADAVIFVQSLISRKAQWYPQTLVFAEFGVNFPLFIRAVQKSYFEKFKVLFGGGDSAKLKAKIAEAIQGLRGITVLHYVNITNLLGYEKWATID